MQPWRISAGLTVVLAGSAVLVGGSRLEYLAPFWRVILAEYGLVIAAALLHDSTLARVRPFSRPFVHDTTA